MFYQVNFPSIGSFCFNETKIHFPNENDQLEFETIKQKHTNIIVELLSEWRLNGRYIISELESTQRVLDYWRDRVINLKNRYSTDHYDGLLNPIADLMAENIDFINDLWDYYRDVFPIRSKFDSAIKREEEMKKLNDLISNLDVSNENQTMVLQHIPVQQAYNEGIVSVLNFTLHRHSKRINDLRSTSTLYYDVVLPFHNKNYDPTSTDCTSGRDLPYLYKHNTY